MRFQFLIMMLFFAFSKATSQNTEYSNLLEDAIHSFRDSATIFYIDSSFSFYGKFSRFAKNRRVEGFTDHRIGNKTAMLFSRKELRDADWQFSKQHQILWPDSFLKNSVRLSQDSLPEFLEYRYLPEFQSQNKYRYYYYFSQPIFLRDNSVVIFRFAEMINTSAGYDFVFIYVKDNDGWRRKMTIHAGSW